MANFYHQSLWHKNLLQLLIQANFITNFLLIKMHYQQTLEMLYKD